MRLQRRTNAPFLFAAGLLAFALLVPRLREFLVSNLVLVLQP